MSLAPRSCRDLFNPMQTPVFARISLTRSPVGFDIVMFHQSCSWTIGASIDSGYPESVRVICKRPSQSESCGQCISLLLLMVVIRETLHTATRYAPPPPPRWLSLFASGYALLEHTDMGRHATALVFYSVFERTLNIRVVILDQDSFSRLQWHRPSTKVPRPEHAIYYRHACKQRHTGRQARWS